jgi:hypothetical protein
VHKQESELVKMFNVTSYPSLYIYKNVENDMMMEKPQIVKYGGNMTDLDHIFAFIETLANKQKRSMEIIRGSGKIDT